MPRKFGRNLARKFGRVEMLVTESSCQYIRNVILPSISFISIDKNHDQRESYVVASSIKMSYFPKFLIRPCLHRTFGTTLSTVRKNQSIRNNGLSRLGPPWPTSNSQIRRVHDDIDLT